MNDKEILRIAVMQMLEHNETHIAQCEKLARLAVSERMVDAEALLRKAAECDRSKRDVLNRVLGCLSLH